MSEKMRKLVIGLGVTAAFICSLTLIIIGQRNIGPSGLGMMLVGLAGLIFLLWLYNRQYK